MATDYTHRLFVFIEEARQTPANNVTANIDPDTGGANTFGSVRLSSDGNEPATHYGANTAATGPMLGGYEASLAAVPWAGLYKASDGWTWDSALADMGLVVIEADI